MAGRLHANGLDAEAAAAHTVLDHARRTGIPPARPSWAADPAPAT